MRSRLIWLILLSASLAYGQSSTPCPFTSNTSNAEQRECFAREQLKATAITDRIVRDLAAYYRKGEPLSSVVTGMLRSAARRTERSQLLWKRYREEHCQTIADSYTTGTGAGTAYEECLYRLAEERIAELKQLAAGGDELIITAEQLILVTTPDWNSVDGTLTRYERTKDGSWKQLVQPIPIVVGKNGLASAPHFFRGNNRSATPVKHEGDGRSPAGIFTLGESFGFADSLPGSPNYIPLTENTECVDDINSRYYGQVVDRSQVPQPDWSSSEKMREVQGYRWGVVVNYNTGATALKGNGSCIFLHAWSGPHHGTAGCTAMELPQIEELVHWIKPEEAVLVQLPDAEYKRLKREWHLP